jgi:hypothetical protein
VTQSVSTKSNITTIVHNSFSSELLLCADEAKRPIIPNGDGDSERFVEFVAVHRQSSHVAVLERSRILSVPVVPGPKDALCAEE